MVTAPDRFVHLDGRQIGSRVSVVGGAFLTALAFSALIVGATIDRGAPAAGVFASVAICVWSAVLGVMLRRYLNEQRRRAVEAKADALIRGYAADIDEPERLKICERCHHIPDHLLQATSGFAAAAGDNRRRKMTH